MTSAAPQAASSALLAGDVHVWIFNLDLNTDRRRALYGYLGAAERERAARFKFDLHRNRFVTSRGMQRLILSEYIDGDPRAIEFGTNAHGKPYLRGDDLADIRFSATDSAEFGALALCLGNELGLDLEMHRENPDRDKIVELYFCRRELDWYASLDQEQRDTAFFRMWTCKEAYLKGLGTGLTTDLDSFAIDYSAEPPQLAWADPQQHPTSAEWQLHSLDLVSGSSACLAVNGRFERLIASRWEA